jgi:hypothetical protein
VKTNTRRDPFVSRGLHLGTLAIAAWMSERFGVAYDDDRHRVKALVPFRS